MTLSVVPAVPPQKPKRQRQKKNNGTPPPKQRKSTIPIRQRVDLKRMLFELIFIISENIKFIIFVTIVCHLTVFLTLLYFVTFRSFILYLLGITGCK